MPADWSAIENALHALAVRRLGFANDHVIWDQQNGARPTVPFASMRIDNDTTQAGLDEVRPPRDATSPAPGADIVVETVKHTEFTCTVQVFGVAATGSSSPRALLIGLRNSLSLDSEIETLDAANLAVIEQGTVQNLTALLENDFEPRAVLAIRLRTADGAEDLTTWIETVEHVTELTE
jgi:hypothetical protein